jgi:hypothetical protein
MKLHTTIMLAAVALCVQAGAATASATATTAAPSKKDLSAALTRYLADYGQLCVGKYDWPITVMPQDAGNGERNAVQMPAMAEAGLVQVLPASDGAMVYRLTDAGRKYYWPRKINRRDGAPGQADVHDFCAGRLALDQVVRWTPPVQVGDHLESTATYTYSIAPAPWTADPRLQQVFPMIDRVIKGQHKAQLAQRLRLVEGKWEAVLAVE